jgi:hypothetical protein
MLPHVTKADLGRIVTNYEILAREDIGVQVDGMRTLVKLHSSKFQLDWDLRRVSKLEAVCGLANIQGRE